MLLRKISSSIRPIKKRISSWVLNVRTWLGLPGLIRAEQTDGFKRVKVPAIGLTKQYCKILLSVTTYLASEGPCPGRR